jgi:dihydroxyacid dehydratase/phosphogluconate dehydratase
VRAPAIGLAQDGDLISIDIAARSLRVELSNGEEAQGAAAASPPPPRWTEQLFLYHSGSKWL